MDKTRVGEGLKTATSKLGFVGLGHMGGNMAARFLGAGYPVYGEARSRERAEHLLDEGLTWCETPRELAEAVDIVLTSIPDDAALEDVAPGPDGILEGLEQGKVWVDLSTVSPRASREVAKRVRERGAAMLDAPVSGSVPQVQGGDVDDHGRWGGGGMRPRGADPPRARDGDARRRQRAGARP